MKPKRPTSLAMSMPNSQSASNNISHRRNTNNNIPTSTRGNEGDLLPIQTPSAGLNFTDMDWSDLPPTGLTPTSGATPHHFNSITTPTPLVTPSTANVLFASLGHNPSKKGADEENVKMVQL